MSAQRTFATFDAELLDDSELSESGDILIPGGRGVSLLIRRLLQELGLVISEPEQHQFYGWKLNGEKDGSKFWFLLQYPNPWLLIIEDRTRFIVRNRSEKDLFKQIISNLNGKMVAEDRIRSVQWFKKRNMKAA